MALRVLCDEHVGKKSFYRQLRRKFTARHVLDVPALGRGSSDTDIWNHAININFNVLTADSHFVDGTANPGNGTHPGILFYDDDAKISECVTALEAIETHLSSSQIASNDDEIYIPDGWLQYAP